MDKWIQLQSSDGINNLFPVGMIDLLWSNSSVTSSFASQTISLDFTGYQYLVLTFRQSSGANYTRTLACVITNISSTTQYCQMFAWINGIIRVRNIDINNSSIVFGAGVNYNSYSNGTGTTDNSVVIPMAIYGVKANIHDLT